MVLVKSFRTVFLFAECCGLHLVVLGRVWQAVEEANGYCSGSSPSNNHVKRFAVVVNSVLRGNDLHTALSMLPRPSYYRFYEQYPAAIRVNDDAAPSQAPVGSHHHRTSNSQRNRQLNAAQKLGGEAYGGASADLQPSEEGLSMADYWASLARQLDELIPNIHIARDRSG